MSEIKPRMVDGEAVCGDDCGNLWDGHCALEPPVYICDPYYRARVAALEAERGAAIKAVADEGRKRGLAEARADRLAAVVEGVREWCKHELAWNVSPRAKLQLHSLLAEPTTERGGGNRVGYDEASGQWLNAETDAAPSKEPSDE